MEQEDRSMSNPKKIGRENKRRDVCACTFEFSASTLLVSLYLGDAFSSCIETIKKLTELLKTKTFCCFRTTFTYRNKHMNMTHGILND